MIKQLIAEIWDLSEKPVHFQKSLTFTPGCKNVLAFSLFAEPVPFLVSENYQFRVFHTVSSFYIDLDF